MKIPSSWQLDNCVTAGEMRPPVSVYLLLLGAFSYCSPLLSVALLGFSEAKKFSDFLFILFFSADQFVDEKSICNRSQLGEERILNPVTLPLRAGGRQTQTTGI